MTDEKAPDDADKSPRDFRSILESFRCRESAAGPLADGLRNSDRILIASFVNHRVCRRFRRDLTAAGIPSTVVSDGVNLRVEVRYVDREAAFELLARQQYEYSDRSAPGSRRDYDWTFLGFIAGTTLGLALLVQRTANLGVLLVGCLGAIATGTTVGFALDRALRRLRQFDRLQFRMSDVFLLTLAVAALVAFWTMVSRFASLPPGR